MFFIVKNHWEPSFMDNPRISTNQMFSTTDGKIIWIFFCNFRTLFPVITRNIILKHNTGDLPNDPTLHKAQMKHIFFWNGPILQDTWIWFAWCNTYCFLKQPSSCKPCAPPPPLLLPPLLFILPYSWLGLETHNYSSNSRVPKNARQTSCSLGTFRWIHALNCVWSGILNLCFGFVLCWLTKL
jgi:hypothetical protein